MVEPRRTTSSVTATSRKLKSVGVMKGAVEGKRRARDFCGAAEERPSLQALRARHSDEKRMIDQLVKRSMLA